MYTGQLVFFPSDRPPANAYGSRRCVQRYQDERYVKRFRCLDQCQRGVRTTHLPGEPSILGGIATLFGLDDADIIAECGFELGIGLLAQFIAVKEEQVRELAI